MSVRNEKWHDWNWKSTMHVNVHVNSFINEMDLQLQSLTFRFWKGYFSTLPVLLHCNIEIETPIHLATTSWSQLNSFCLQVWYLIPIINNIFYPLMHISLITYYSHITYILHPVHIFYLRFLLPMVRHAKCAKQPWQSSKHLVRESSMQYKKSFQLHVQYRTSVFNQGVTPLRDL